MQFQKDRSKCARAPKKWNSRAQLPINLYTACKTYSKMTHNVTSGY